MLCVGNGFACIELMIIGKRNDNKITSLKKLFFHHLYIKTQKSAKLDKIFTKADEICFEQFSMPQKKKDSKNRILLDIRKSIYAFIQEHFRAVLTFDAVHHEIFHLACKRNGKSRS